MLNWTDIAILCVLGLSVLVGLWRGLVCELLALAIWAVAFWLTWLLGPQVAEQLPSRIAQPQLRVAMAYGACFVGVLILGALVRFLIDRLVTATGFGGMDRLLGMFFGLARGALLVALAVFLLGFTRFVRDDEWKQSCLLPVFQGMAAWLGNRMPADWHRHADASALLDRLPNVTHPHLPDLHLPDGMPTLSQPGRQPPVTPAKGPLPAPATTTL